MRYGARLLDGGHVAAVFDDYQLRMRNGGGDFFVLRDRAPGVFASAENERRTLDERQHGAGFGTIEQSALLAGELLGRVTFDHFGQGRQQGGMVRMQHGRKPSRGHGFHALRAGDLDQRTALFLFRRTAWMDAGVEQSQAFDPIRRHAENFEGDACAHGMPGEGEAGRRGIQHQLRHRGDGAQAAEIGNDDVRDFAQRVPLMGPDGLIAEQAGQQNNGHLTVVTCW